MTRVYYQVGNFKTRSYQEAKARSEKFKIAMKTRYEEIVERVQPDPERLALIYKYFEERRKKRAVLQA